MSNKVIDVTFSSLDPSQKSAFKAINNDDSNLHIVHGPPGTGKSQLVVSLLERLASENKKVLFVSQNTEALKVIERMIKHTEKSIGYPEDGKYVSLLDFCLMLYNPNHRYLKHLREQYTRISGKQLPFIGGVPEPINIEYALRYTNLSHEENYNVGDSNIGFDELVGYFIKYVNHNMAPEPIRSFERVDVRTVFNTLDNYKNTDHFSEFNLPRRELVLLSTKNTNLSLPDVRNSLKNIKDVLSGEWIKYFKSNSSIDIMDYLNLIKEYSTAIEFLDVYKIATEGKDIAELAGSLKKYIESCEDAEGHISRIDERIVDLSNKLSGEVGGVSYTSQKIGLNSPTINIADKDFSEVISDRKRIIQLINKVLELYPDIVHASIQDVWVGLGIVINGFYGDSIQDETGLVRSLTVQDIDRLNNDLEVYYSQNSVKRMIGGIPVSFKESLNFTNVKHLDTYRDELQSIFHLLRDILALEVEGATVASVLAIGKNNPKIPLSRMGVKSPINVQELKDAFLPIHELVILLKKYSVSIEDFNMTKAQLKEFDAGIVMLNNLINNTDNKKLYLSGNLDNFINTVNTTIDIEMSRQEKADLLSSQKDLQNESYRQNGQYLENVTESADYAKVAKVVYEYLNNKEEGIVALLDGVAIPDNNLPIEADLGIVSKVINEVNLSDNFSDYFFEISSGQTLYDWLASITVLEVYNNDAEIVDFIEHNKSINDIYVAMGEKNKQYLDNILDDDITFAIFATRIVNVLVGESFGRARITDKKRITTQDVIDSYNAYLKNQKAKTYSENLRYIYDQSLDATKELSKQTTLQVGGRSTMDKFRHNSHIIADAFPIICATPKDVSKYIAGTKGLFDYVIFDEASQLLPGQAIPSIYRAKKAVIIGDPHQMPPTLNASFGSVDQTEDDFDDLGESILDLLLKQPQKQHHLKVHYRSKYNKLFEPSRESIYSSDGIEPIFEAELANGAPIDIKDDLGDELDEHGYDKNFYKICESVTDYIDKNNKADFCILFTRGDVLSRFKEFLADVGERQFSKVSKLYNLDKILVSTVTNCQGIEGAYTIIYLHHYSSPGAMWFFKESAGAYKRLNVSITRQREGLQLLLADKRSHWIKVCDEKMNRSSTGPNASKSAELMRALLISAGEEADTTYLDRKLGANISWFDSPLTEQLYSKLTDHYAEKMGRDIKIYSEVGWNLLIPTGEGIDANERNVGFRIDLGIYSIKQKKFILGIEMDGAMYHSGFDKEHSDYNRQKVLEDKGWELYRIWSTNWLNDNEREFSKLIQSIDKKISA